MKQQIHNLFYKYFRSNTIARFLTSIAYFLLKTYYRIAKVFLLKHKNELLVDQKEVGLARDYLRKKSEYKKTKLIINNHPSDNEIELSIIMPAYNVEKYIVESIKSIVNQKSKYEYELIVVNDGSTDETENIIKAIDDEHIVLINQDNQGLSGARNTGLNNAKGKYVFFIDSDDVMEQNSIDLMMDAIIKNDADISIGGYYLFYDDSNLKQIMKGIDKVVEDNPNEIIYNPGFAWGKVYKRELFYNVRFPLGAWFEDTIICSVIYRKCKKMAKISDCVYGYRQNWNGISKQSKKSYKVLDHIWVMEDAIEQAHNNGIEDDEYLYALCFGHFSSIMSKRMIYLDEETKKNAFIVACDIMRKMEKNKGYNKKGIEKDINRAFETGNYKLWKLASFVV